MTNKFDPAKMTTADLAALGDYLGVRFVVKLVPKEQPERSHRILWNQRPSGMRDAGNIDEIVIDHPTMVHVEQMDERCWWIGIYLTEVGQEPRRWSGHFTADSKGRMTFSEQDNEIEWAEDESHDDDPAAGGDGSEVSE